MTCAREDKLLAFVNEMLAPAEAAAIEEHLDGCDR